MVQGGPDRRPAAGWGRGTGATEAQQRELERLRSLMSTLETRQGAGTPVMQETTRVQLQQAGSNTTSTGNDTRDNRSGD